MLPKGAPGYRSPALKRLRLGQLRTALGPGAEGQAGSDIGEPVREKNDARGLNFTELTY